MTCLRHAPWQCRRRVHARKCGNDVLQITDEQRLSLPITHQITALSIIGWMVADPIQGKYGVI